MTISYKIKQINEDIIKYKKQILERQGYLKQLQIKLEKISELKNILYSKNEACIKDLEIVDNQITLCFKGIDIVFDVKINQIRPNLKKVIENICCQINSENKFFKEEIKDLNNTIKKLKLELIGKTKEVDIFIDGTNQVNWRKELIPKLKTNNFFNSYTKFYTIEHKEITEVIKENSKMNFFCIIPLSDDTRIKKEILELSAKRPENLVVFVLKRFDNVFFDNDKLDSLYDFLNSLEKKGCEVYIHYTIDFIIDVLNSKFERIKNGNN